MNYNKKKAINAIAAFIVIVIGSYVIVAQQTIAGEWKATDRLRDDSSDDSIYLSMTWTRGKGTNRNGRTYKFSELDGLSASSVINGKATFRLIREAGTFEFQGQFTNGTGEGTFRFDPAMGFVDAMRSRGIDIMAEGRKSEQTLEEKLYTAAMLNVTTTLADDLISSGFGKLDLDDLIKAAIFKIDGRFMAEMKATGFPGLTMEELVKARIFKIDADYVRAINAAGFSDLGFEGVVKFAIFKVTPEFLNELRNAGLTSFTAEEVVKFRIFKIDADFIREAKAADPNITSEELVRRRLGVGRLRSTN